MSEQTSLRNPLQLASTYCQREMAALDQCIRTQLQSDISMIPAMGHYIINSGGKRLRPLLCFLSARLFNYEGSRHIPLAMVVEFLHTASLLHDDVVDDSDTRRGRPSAKGVWGNQASVLVGDFLFSRAFEVSVDDGDPTLLHMLSRVTSALAEGEVMQLSHTFHVDIEMQQYLDVVERKTAVLFYAATEIGARVSGQSEQVAQGMREYGMCLGVAFQLMDDALDYMADATTVGKPVLHDLEEGKVTLPLIHAMQSDHELKQRIEVIAERGHYQGDDREWLQKRVERAGGVERCLQEAKSYAERAKSMLPTVGNQDAYQLLEALADFSAARAF
ncbi:MAG: polyprenyl synthetase family protein [Mariprofundaceae bacterium]